jgi:hypothetical protein
MISVLTMRPEPSSPGEAAPGQLAVARAVELCVPGGGSTASEAVCST